MRVCVAVCLLLGVETPAGSPHAVAPVLQTARSVAVWVAARCTAFPLSASVLSSVKDVAAQVRVVKALESA